MSRDKFEQSTKLFYSNQYAKGLELVYECLQSEPQNSILYNNLGLFLYHLDREAEALEAMNKALSLNCLNYIVYFNLFSLNIRANNQSQALTHILCSLSCLYLIRARTTKNSQDAQKALQLCPNNLQAIVLLILISISENNVERIKMVKQKYLQNNQASFFLFKTNELVDNYIQSENHQFQTLYEALSKIPIESNRLIPKALDQCDSRVYEQVIQQRVKQFNSLYGELDKEVGSITHLVPKYISFSKRQESYMQKSMIGKVKM